MLSHVFSLISDTRDIKCFSTIPRIMSDSQLGLIILISAASFNEVTEDQLLRNNVWK